MPLRNDSKYLFILSMILIGVGDIFYFGALLFRDFSIEFLMTLSPAYLPTDLSDAGRSVGLFYSATMGALMYLTGFLVWSLTKETLAERRKFAFYGLWIWFVTDTIASLLFSFSLNVFMNFLFLIIGVAFLGYEFKD